MRVLVSRKGAGKGFSYRIRATAHCTCCGQRQSIQFRAGGDESPWMIVRDGRNRGFVFCFSAISAWRPARIFLAIAVPSILAARP